MRFKWVDAEQTVGNIVGDDGHTVVVEPGHPEWESFLASAPEPYAPDVDPDPVGTARANMRLSFAQLLIGLVTEGWITAAEGRAWRDRVALPAQVQALIATLPEAQQFAAETRAFAPSEVHRNDPLVVGLGQVSGRTPAELDAFFWTYVQA